MNRVRMSCGLFDTLCGIADKMCVFEAYARHVVMTHKCESCLNGQLIAID